jgi:hypothetical protein
MNLRTNFRSTRAVILYLMLAKQRFRCHPPYTVFPVLYQLLAWWSLDFEDCWGPDD